MQEGIDYGMKLWFKLHIPGTWYIIKVDWRHKCKALAGMQKALLRELEQITQSQVFENIPKLWPRIAWF